MHPYNPFFECPDTNHQLVVKRFMLNRSARAALDHRRCSSSVLTPTMILTQSTFFSEALHYGKRQLQRDKLEPTAAGGTLTWAVEDTSSCLNAGLC